MKTLNIAVVAGAALAVALSAVVAAMAAAPNAAAPPPTAITVFDQPNFKGQSLTFERSVPSLAALQFNDRPRSVRIKGSRDWVLCEHRNFMGKCVRVRAREKDLKRLKIAGQVSSLYPVPVPAKKGR